PLDERPECALVDRAIGRKRRDERRAAADKTRHARLAGIGDINTSRMVNTPLRPISHAAATRAPSAKARRSRAVCVNVIVSNGASKIISCVPGTDPVRTLVTGISRGQAAAAD